jgi:hypothetical protein
MRQRDGGAQMVKTQQTDALAREHRRLDRLERQLKGARFRTHLSNWLFLAPAYLILLFTGWSVWTSGMQDQLIPLIALSFISGALTAWSARRELGLKRLEQRVRDQEAITCLRQFQAGTTRPSKFVGCFLRSFELDASFGARHSLSDEYAQRSLSRSERQLRGFSAYSLVEHHLVSAFSTFDERPVVCSLGKQMKGVTFGRVESTNENWQETVQTLLDNSDFFMLMFARSEGTAWEVEQLLEKKLVERTIFFVPPTELLRSGSDLEAYELERAYKHLKQQLGEQGFEAPSYVQGRAFYFRASSCHLLELELPVEENGIPPKPPVSLIAFVEGFLADLTRRNAHYPGDAR